MSTALGILFKWKNRRRMVALLIFAVTPDAGDFWLSAETRPSVHKSPGSGNSGAK
jgi:hypothetical protein